MKKILILLMCAVLLLSSCAFKNGTSSELTETTVDLDKHKFGGYIAENGYWYLDENNPLFTVAKYEVPVELSNGEKGISTMDIPYIDLDTEGARALSDQILENYTAEYKEYFENPDDRIVNISYSYEIDNDTLVILISEKTKTPEEEGTLTYAFYYDILVDTQAGISTFTGVCGYTVLEILEGLYETEWAEEYLEVTGSNPSDSCITAITFNKDDSTFDVYCTNTDGVTQSVITVTPVEQPLDLSGLENIETGE